MDGFEIKQALTDDEIAAALATLGDIINEERLSDDYLSQRQQEVASKVFALRTTEPRNTYATFTVVVAVPEKRPEDGHTSLFQEEDGGLALPPDAVMFCGEEEGITPYALALGAEPDLWPEY